MKTAGSRELVLAPDGVTHYVVIGLEDGTYDLFQARLDHVGTFRRKWQAKVAVDERHQP